jgi:hypothetical protein
MRAPPATNNELFVVLGVAACIAAAILYWQTPKTPVEPVRVQPQPVVAPKWEFGGMGPGWASGRWLGEGDFVHHDKMEHPFRDQPHYSGHPLPPILP